MGAQEPEGPSTGCPTDERPDRFVAFFAVALFRVAFLTVVPFVAFFFVAFFVAFFAVRFLAAFFAVALLAAPSPADAPVVAFFATLGAGGSWEPT